LSSAFQISASAFFAPGCAALLAEQLYRAELVRARLAALVRRLVGEPEAGLPAVRREAAELGLRLADAYWPAVMAWRHMAPREDIVEAIERESVQDGAFAVGRGRGMVLLHPGAGALAWFERVVACARGRTRGRRSGDRERCSRRAARAQRPGV
jgi:hypothetical protein